MLTVLIACALCILIGVQETGTPVGLIFPTVAVVGLVTNSLDGVAMVFASIALACGGILGDCLAVTIGRRAPVRVHAKLMRGNPLLGDRLSRYGAAALLVTRFVPFLRTAAPFALGSLCRTSLREVVPYSALSAIAWSAVVVGASHVLWQLTAILGLSRIEGIELLGALAAACVLVSAARVKIAGRHARTLKAGAPRAGQRLAAPIRSRRS